VGNAFPPISFSLTSSSNPSAISVRLASSSSARRLLGVRVLMSERRLSHVVKISGDIAWLPSLWCGLARSRVCFTLLWLPALECDVIDAHIGRNTLHAVLFPLTQFEHAVDRYLLALGKVLR